MARLVSTKSELHGDVWIPGSKSHTIRAVAFGALAAGTSIIRRPLLSLDALSAARCYQALGAAINREAGSGEEAIWEITGLAGEPRVPDNVLDVGNSGTTMNFALGTASLLPAGAGRVVLTGDEQIRRRPSGPLVASLNDLGAWAASTRNCDLPPFVVAGRLRGGRTRMQAASSQYLSSLLACCPFAPGESTIEITLLNEKPYVEMTLAWLDRLGLTYENDAFRAIRVPGGQRAGAFECVVPADFSTATFFLCAAALCGREVRLRGLDLADTQGDKAVIEYLRRMGAAIEAEKEAIVVRAAPLHGAELDLNATPDALPALAVTACFAEGPTVLGNVPQARQKETDRIAVMAAELTKLGAEVEELPDGLVVRSCRLRAGEVDGHGDHRVVMALALAGFVSREPITVLGSEAAAVTVPQYVPLMAGLGANLHETA